MRRVVDLAHKMPIIQALVVWVSFCALALVKLHPVLSRLGTHISDPGDPLLVSWILAWDFHALTTDPWNLFQANIFYRAENTLAFSEHSIGILPIFAPAYALTGNPIFAYNVVFLLSFPLSGLSMFLLVRHSTRNFWASLLAGALFAFAPLRFGQLSHLQLLNLYWTPLALLFLDRFLHGKRWMDLIGLAVSYWLQVLCSVYLGWFATIALALYWLYYVVFVDRALLSRPMLLRYVAFAALSLVVLLPFHLPYFEVQRQWGVTRSVAECVFSSADLALSYLSVPYLMSDLYRSIFSFAGSSHWEKRFFPGLVLPLLVALGSRGDGKSLALEQRRRMRRIFWLILAASFILSLGPFLVIFDQNTGFPLPYLLLYHLVPGFQGMRAPARFSLMAVLAACILAALGFLRACDIVRHRAELKGRHAEVPEVYRWLAVNQLGPIVEFPIGM